MFKHRSIQVKFVKDADAPVTETAFPSVSPEDISRIAKDLVNHTAVKSVIVIGAVFALHTASQIIVNACDTPKKKED